MLKVNTFFLSSSTRPNISRIWSLKMPCSSEISSIRGALKILNVQSGCELDEVNKKPSSCFIFIMYDPAEFSGLAWAFGERRDLNAAPG